MAHLSSIALRVHHLDALVSFYSEAFHVQFREVDTFGIASQFGEVNGISLKFVPIRDGEDFKNYPIHQPGFTVPDVETVIALAVKYGGWQEGELIRDAIRSRQPFATRMAIRSSYIQNHETTTVPIMASLWFKRLFKTISIFGCSFRVQSPH